VACDQSEQGGFTDPISAHNAQHLTLTEVEADTSQNQRIAIAAADVLNNQACFVIRLSGQTHFCPPA
jgi:hypothetical protein